MKRALLAAAGIAATAAVAMPLGASADHRAGHDKGAGQNGDLTIASTPNPLLWARPVTISGRLRGAENAAKTIELQENPHPYAGPFKTTKTTTTNDQGDYTFKDLPQEHTKYRVVAKVTPEETSSEELVQVRMRINRRVSDTTPRRGQVVTFTGKVAPAHDGRTVYIQRRRADGVWRTKASAVLQDAGASDPANSVYSGEVRVNRDGTYRVLVKADANHLGNKTRRIRLDTP